MDLALGNGSFACESQRYESLLVSLDATSSTRWNCFNSLSQPCPLFAFGSWPISHWSARFNRVSRSSSTVDMLWETSKSTRIRLSSPERLRWKSVGPASMNKIRKNAMLRRVGSNHRIGFERWQDSRQYQRAMPYEAAIPANKMSHQGQDPENRTAVMRRFPGQPAETWLLFCFSTSERGFVPVPFRPGSKIQALPKPKSKFHAHASPCAIG